MRACVARARHGIDRGIRIRFADRVPKHQGPEGGTSPPGGSGDTVVQLPVAIGVKPVLVYTCATLNL